MTNHMAAISPDGKLMAVATHMPVPAIYQITSNRDTGRLADVEKVGKFQHGLKQHKATVKGIAFGPNNQRAVTASQDGTGKLWDISVRFDQKADPKLVHTFNCGP